jgi:glycosyltransferase involved in cell wall biosynthesis
MRVLFLAHAYPRYPGDPVGSFVLRLASALRLEAIDVTVLVPGGPDLPAKDTIEGIPVVRYRYAPRSFETLAYAGTMGAQVRGSWRARAALAGLLAASFAKARSLAKREGAAVVHAHWWFPGGLAGSWIHRISGLPLVTTLHGSDIRLAGEFPVGRSAFRSVARASASVTAVSSWLARQASALEPSVQPIVAPMPVVTDLFYPGSGLADRLLFVGKLTEQKGLQHLLRALTLMRAKPTVDVVGAGRVDDAHLRRMAEELGVADRINWLPLMTQAQLAELYRRATLHVMPAIEEGLGLTAVESLLCETAVVAFDSGGVPDIVVNEKTGLLVPPGDAHALAIAVDRLLAHPHERAALGRQGRAHVQEHFAPVAVARRYASIYRDATTRRRS